MEYDNLKQIKEIAKQIEALNNKIEQVEETQQEAKYFGFATINGMTLEVSSSFLTAERTSLIIQIEQLKKKLLPL